MKPATHPSALRVQAALGEGFKVVEFEESTKTAADAAAAVGCTVAQIAKSIICRGAPSNRAVLVIASGSNRVDEKKVAALLGESLARADADFVRAQTGFAIGGVQADFRRSRGTDRRHRGRGGEEGLGQLVQIELLN